MRYDEFIGQSKGLLKKGGKRIDSRKKELLEVRQLFITFVWYGLQFFNIQAELIERVIREEEQIIRNIEKKLAQGENKTKQML